jgi:hypothetical protein
VSEGEGERRYSQWTVETLKQHHDALREADNKFLYAVLVGGFLLGHERDRRYTEKDEAREKALDAALVSIRTATDVLASAYRSDKTAQNEWRATVNDIISKLGGGKASTEKLITYAILIGGFLLALSGKVHFTP